MAKTKKIPIPSNSRVAILHNLLIQSILVGRLVDVKKWVDQGACVNVKAMSAVDRSSTITPIAAILFGKYNFDRNDENKEYFKILQLFVEMGADINKAIWLEQENQFQVPLAISVMYGFKDFVEYLIKNGAKMDIRYRDNTNLLFLAVEGNHVEIAKILLEFKQIKSKIDFKHKVTGFTPLHHAVHHCNIEMAKLLLDHGANVNARNEKAFTSALHSACALKLPLEFVKLLVEKGAEIDLQHSDGGTPMMLALAAKNVEVVKYLLENGANPNNHTKERNGKIYPLHMILDQDKFLNQDKLLDMAIFKLLIKHGAKLETKCGGYGKLTPLQLAARRGKSFETKYLIDMGADMNVLDDLGRSAVHIAIQEGSKRSLDTAKILIKAGANVNTAFGDNMLWSPLHSAVMDNDFEMVKLLVEAGANVNAKDRNGRTPIRYAYDCKQWYVKTVYNDNIEYDEDYDKFSSDDNTNENDSDGKDENESDAENEVHDDDKKNDSEENEEKESSDTENECSEAELKYFWAGFVLFEQFENHRKRYHKMMHKGEDFDDYHDIEELDCGKWHGRIDYVFEQKVQFQIRDYLLENGAYQIEGIGKKMLVLTRLGYKYFR